MYMTIININGSAVIQIGNVVKPKTNTTQEIAMKIITQ